MDFGWQGGWLPHLQLTVRIESRWFSGGKDGMLQSQGQFVRLHINLVE